MAKRQKDRRYNGQKNKDRQYNGQKNKDRRYNGQKNKDSDLENTTQKTKNRATRIPLKLWCSGGVCCSCFTCDTRRVTIVTV